MALRAGDRADGLRDISGPRWMSLDRLDGWGCGIGDPLVGRSDADECPDSEVRRTVERFHQRHCVVASAGAGMVWAARFGRFRTGKYVVS